MQSELYLVVVLLCLRRAKCTLYMDVWCVYATSIDYKYLIESASASYERGHRFEFYVFIFIDRDLLNILFNKQQVVKWIRICWSLRVCDDSIELSRSSDGWWRWSWAFQIRPNWKKNLLNNLWTFLLRSPSSRTSWILLINSGVRARMSTYLSTHQPSFQVN